MFLSHTHFDKSPYNLVLLEEVVYECVKNKKTVFSSPSCQEIEPFSILQEFQEEDSLFINKEIAYCKLREEGWFLSNSYIIHR